MLWRVSAAFLVDWIFTFIYKKLSLFFFPWDFLKIVQHSLKIVLSYLSFFCSCSFILSVMCINRWSLADKKDYCNKYVVSVVPV